ncbi:MAG: type II toxin-antitoxin system RelE/ParE family toxin [Gammaproteobacteria bacterium]|nr:type II toxin-antitoxin system RelE/ParE family toxin [Gammaproteobacteria bacterium]MCW5583735.1 type II toxin-antitoxin system RelE/ParE family toxin [Gammaproteobacteria bacterium]
MAWTIDFDKKAKKEFVSLDKSTQKQIDKFLLKLMKSANPRQFGEALKGNMQFFWHYRVGDYRLICSIEDNVLTVIVLRVKHRKEVYKKNV